MYGVYVPGMCLMLFQPFLDIQAFTGAAGRTTDSHYYSRVKLGYLCPVLRPS
jgi:hypothetical protein